MLWQKQKVTYLLPAKQVALIPGQQAGTDGPVLGCQKHPSTPLWADQLKLITAFWSWKPSQAQIWPGTGQRKRPSTSPWVKRRSLGADMGTLFLCPCAQHCTWN